MSSPLKPNELFIMSISVGTLRTSYSAFYTKADVYGVKRSPSLIPRNKMFHSEMVIFGNFKEQRHDIPVSYAGTGGNYEQ